MFYWWYTVIVFFHLITFFLSTLPSSVLHFSIRMLFVGRTLVQMLSWHLQRYWLWQVQWEDGHQCGLWAKITFNFICGYHDSGTGLMLMPPAVIFFHLVFGLEIWIVRGGSKLKWATVKNSLITLPFHLLVTLSGECHSECRIHTSLHGIDSILLNMHYNHLWRQFIYVHAQLNLPILLCVLHFSICCCIGSGRELWKMFAWEIAVQTLNWCLQRR